MTSYYDVLGVGSDADQEAIRDAYREKVKEYHPDVSDHPDAEERFKRVKRAEVVLTDPAERDRYDRLGHERYVDGAPFDGSERPDDVTDVRDAAARAAGRNHDAGGPTAGWRQRERRAYEEARDYWASTGTGPFDDSRDETDWSEGSDPWTSGAGVEDPFSSGAAGNGGVSPSEDPFADSADRETSSTSDPDASAATGTVSDPPPGYAAADGWGGTSDRASTHTVSDWAAEEPSVAVPRPNWTQDDLVLLGSTILLYPILLYLTVAPVMPLIANVAIGAVTFTLVAFLLPRPSFALPVFGTWSVLLPLGMLSAGVSLFSMVGLVALIGVWLPLAYSLAVAKIIAM